MAKTPAKKTQPEKGKGAKKEKAAGKATPVKKRAASPAKKTKPAAPKKKKVTDEGLELALNLAQGMYEKKAEDIRILDMRSISGASADFFVISHGSNDKQAEAIARSAEEEANKKSKQHVWHREGYENCEWILLDYIDVVAHIFQRDKREFYGVEELWGDAEMVPFQGK